MLICKRNADHQIREAALKTVNQVEGLINKDFCASAVIAAIKEYAMIKSLLTNPIFYGKHDTSMVNLTSYYINRNFQGLDKDEALLRSKDESTYHFYVGFDQDPWNKLREYTLMTEFEGINILNIVPHKNCIIGALLHYDGYNVRQSVTLKFSRYGDKWYMNHTDDTYSHIESTIKQMYNQLNY